MKLRKHIALLLSAAMVLSMAPATVLAAETEPIASFSFDDASLVNDVDDSQSATARVTGLGSYNKDVVYETGMDGTGHALRVGDYGIQLNQKDIGTEYTVSFWVKLDGSLSENQVLILMGYHSPENWMALSGSTNGYKHWGKGGTFSTHTTVNSPAIPTGEWMNLVYCGENNSVTSYLNGKKLGTFNSNNPLSGANADIYLGVNNWDPGAKALIDNVNVYDTVLSEEEIQADYDAGALGITLAELNIGDTSEVKADLVLPIEVGNGIEVEWESSNEEVVSKTGVVTRPEEGKEAAVVTLTAVVTVNGEKYQKSFEVTVLPWSTDADLAEAVEALAVPSVVYEDIVLPTTGKFGSTVTWETSDEAIIAADGTICERPAVGEGNKAVTLKATISLNGKTQETSFEVEVLEEFYGYIMAYTRGNNDLTGSLHLAYSEDGENFTALNSNTGILFVKVDTNNGNASLSTGFRYNSPYLFRKADGTFGMTATQSDRLTSVYMYDSEDLITYTGERLVDTGSTVGNVREPEVEFDSATSAYRVNWKSASGAEYSNLTADLINLEPAVAYDYEADTSTDALGTIPSGAIAGNVIEVTKAEYDKVVKKLGVVENTGIEEVEINVEVGETVKLPKTVTAYYSDDSTAKMNVKWDTTGIDFSKAGTYEVTGEIEQEVYANPLIPQRADPHIEFDEDEELYYFTASYPAFYNVNGGYDRIILRESATIAGLADAEEITIWDAPDSGQMARHVWAPEIHKIEGEFYVFFAAGNSNAVWNIRPYVLVCQDDDNPYDPESWLLPDGTAEIHAATSQQYKYFKQMSLDMTYFEHNDHHYVIWADIIGQSALYMQEVDPYAPWEGISDEVICLTTPEYAWERDVQRVNEGASVIKNDGKIYVAFSGSGTGPEYCIGLLSMDENDDPMDLDSWTKVCYPVLTSSDVPGEYGPGHNSFTVDENGNAMFVYHARSEECYRNQCQWASSDSLYDPCRHARVKRVHWASDGTPILNMSYEEELAPEFKTITATVTVSEEVELPYTDVAEGDWFYNAVEYTYVEGLMTGMTPTTFGPYGQLSRAQFALMLHRMEGEVVVETDKAFGDITGDEWYGPAVLWAAENGIVTGYQDGNFGPADLITREQMAVMMFRYAKYLKQDVTADADYTSFTDADSVSGFATEAMKWAVGSQIITGKDEGTKLDPQGNTARAEAALIIQRFMGK